MINLDIYRRVVGAKMYIDENYQDPIGLDEISREALMSPYYFHRIFRKIYRFTPHEYLTRRRMEKARELLSGNKPVIEVCWEVGFESLGSFSSLFKKEIGLAPSFFRNLACLRNEQLKEQPGKAIPHCFIQGYKLDTPKKQE